MSFVAAALRSRMGSWVAASSTNAGALGAAASGGGAAAVSAVPRDVAIKAMSGLGSPTHPLQSDDKSSSASSSSSSSSVVAEVGSSNPHRLNSSDLAKIVSETHQMTFAEAKRVLATVLDTVTDSLLEQKSVRLEGLGTLSTYEGRARKGIDPNTREPLHIPPKTRIRFKAHRGLKKSLLQKDGGTTTSD